MGALASICPLCAKSGQTRCSKRTCVTPANVFAPQTPKGQKRQETKEQRNKETRFQGSISVRPTRKPRLSIRWPVPLESRAAERRTSGEKFQEPPRSIWLLQSSPFQAEPSVGAPSGTVRKSSRY